eukprot:TRINITY_DN6826_c0_g1_i1.p1 TRINITY_DN6826_c0_g1~~TRINITY_DN6826_c0_g1_i1.p1  ORF type:complete len:476 (-),score=118.99 TRINITY_DN6826_c0_g1_i1:87-1514(-)
MTRFARKDKVTGSSRREPEEATPWSEMVQSINLPDRGIEDEDDEEYVDEMGGVPIPVQLEGGEEEEDDEEDEDGPQKLISAGDDDSDNQDQDDNDDEEEEERGLVDDLEDPEAGDGSRKRKIELISSDEPKKKKKRKKVEKCLVCRSKDHRKMDCPELPEERRKELQDLVKMKVERKGHGTGRKKNKNKKKKKDQLPYEDKENMDNQNLDDDEDEHESSSPKPKSDKHSNTDSESEKKGKKKKNKKNKNKKMPSGPPPGGVIRDRSGAVVEKGEVIFHGFRVLKEDAVRLHDLYKELKTKALSREEVEEAVKKERRIAEKRLARSKKLVCFKCRQPGHMLSNCPLEGSATESKPDSGICFKCGSLEHISKDCKSKQKREGAYNFATCFICKQEGHIAKACPDNPKGLYPRGGGCIFCGSVEHLKRDCPRKVEKDMSKGVRVGTIGANDLEFEPNLVKLPKKKKKNEVKAAKVVAF